MTIPGYGVSSEWTCNTLLNRPSRYRIIDISHPTFIEYVQRTNFSNYGQSLAARPFTQASGSLVDLK